MTAVKICGLTSLQDALWACQSGADLLGFIFVDASSRYVAPETATHIIEAIRRKGCRAKLVGVFAGASIESVVETVEACHLDLEQLHGGEPPAFADSLGVPYIVARRIADRVPWEELAGYSPWAYLFDSYHRSRLGGTGHAWDWSVLVDKPPDMAPLIVAGGLRPENVAEAIRQTGAWGVDVSSGVETSPGRKDHGLVTCFIKSAKGETLS